MRIKQILNNNVALVKRGGDDVIVISKGIGVKKKKGQNILDDEIDKLYILDSYDMLDHFSHLLLNSNPEDILLVQEIVTYAEKVLDIEVNDSAVLTLLDHIDYVIRRARKNQFIKSPLYWDIKRFYPKYFDIGLTALNKINESKDLSIPDDEAVSLALHFINMAENYVNAEHRANMINATRDIMSIIEKHYKMKLDENSINYMRFCTHLQYFVERIFNGKFYGDKNSSNELFKQVSHAYPKEYQAVQKIKLYVQTQYHCNPTMDEQTYLMIHLHRVTERA